MRKKFALPMTLTSLLLGAVILTACATTTTEATDAAASSSSAIADVDATLTAEAVLAANEDATTTNDDEWSMDDAVEITLDGDTATSDSENVTIDGSTVTIDGSTVTITAAGTYVLSGTLDDGQIVVDSVDEGVVALVLDGADISSTTESAITFTTATNAVVSLADGSENTLSDTSAYADTAEANAALYADTDLTITGTGSLTVNGNGNDGITSTDDLVVLSGTIAVDAVDDGLRGKDSLTVEDGDITVTVGGDGLKSDNDEDLTRGYIDIQGGTLDVTAAGDGVDAETDLVITGGSVTVAAGGGASKQVTDTSSKGLKGGTYVIVEGGTIDVDSSDDAVHSNGAIHLGGDAEVTLASGDDGVHADTALLIDGGTVAVTESYEGLESATITVAEGTVDVTASDDGINASAGTTTETTGGGMGGETGGTEMVSITGGDTTIHADGDGFDSNGSAEISGGTLTVYGPTNDGNGALDVNGTLEVSGGTVLAAGSSGMVVSPSDDSAQGFLAATASGEAGSEVEIRDADGTVVTSFTSEKQFASVVYSGSKLVADAEYRVYVDGSEAGTATEGVAAAGGMGGGGMGGGERP
ncbi:carbohydrate-binding domain-containing protein [Conyzicola sp.]|uniref:carbohydrate-binding domain-containing protein n=1 Tax=Conyzicola sp. TaxID=1969404 RepID=UPI003989EED5